MQQKLANLLGQGSAARLSGDEHLNPMGCPNGGCNEINVGALSRPVDSLQDNELAALFGGLTHFEPFATATRRMN
jgi:hypothetical protein